jgi:hypothetical protein
MNIEIAPKETEIQATWDNAMMYCLFLEIDGKTGWRLPTLSELNDIYNSENDFIGSYYWSSTEYNGYWTDTGYKCSNVWIQGLSGGFQTSDDKGSSNYVRAVRDIK